MFVPWALDEGQVQGSGFLEQAELDAANLAGEGLLFALSTISAEGGPFSMVILHVSGGSTAPGTPNIVTSFSADPQVATQRRRLGR